MPTKIDPIQTFADVISMGAAPGSSSGTKIDGAEIKTALNVLTMFAKPLSDGTRYDVWQLLKKHVLTRDASQLALKILGKEKVPPGRVTNGPLQSKMKVSIPPKPLSDKLEGMDGVWIVRPVNDLRKTPNFTNGTLWSATGAIDRWIWMFDQDEGHGKVSTFSNLSFDGFVKQLDNYKASIDDGGKILLPVYVMNDAGVRNAIEAVKLFGNPDKLEFYMADWDFEESMGVGDMFLIYNRKTNEFLAMSKCIYAE